MNIVAHFIRKSTQLNSSFILNQIINHKDFKPVIIYKYDSPKKNDGFADFENTEIPVLSLWDENDYWGNCIFKYSKLITATDVKKIEEFLRKHNVDILHFHYAVDAGIYYPFLKKCKYPCVVSFYGYDAFSFPNIFFGLGKYYLKKRVFPYITMNLVMTEEMYRDVFKIGVDDNKLLIHYHGVPDNFKYFPKVHKSKSKISLLMLSYLDPVKGHIFVLNAIYKMLKEGINNFELTIVGEGHYKNNIQESIEKLNLHGYVNMIGAVKYNSEQYMNVFKNADIFLHPSITTKDDKEGIPGAIVEAMFASLPIIATNHGGIPFVIQNEETGLLVNEWDINELSRAIKKLLFDKKLRFLLGANARNYAVDNLIIEKRQTILEQIYKRLIG